MERVNFINRRTALAQITGPGVCSVAEMMVQFVLEIKAWDCAIPIPFPACSQTIPRPFPDHSQSFLRSFPEYYEMTSFFDNTDYKLHYDQI